MMNIFADLIKKFQRDETQNKTATLLDMENNFLDDDEKENEQDNALIDNGNVGNIDDDDNSDSCSKRKGIITHLTKTNGTLNNDIQFDKKAALHLFEDLHIGCAVEYLVHKKDNTTKVIKIESITEHNWEKSSEAKTQEALDALKLENPKFFNTQIRNIVGIIAERHASTIDVETDLGQQNIQLDDIELSFIPRSGDAVRLQCNIQVDEGYADKQGEILDILRVSPARIDAKQQCVVERVFVEFCVLAADAYVHKEDIPSGIDLHLGDIVLADLIECRYGKYTRRAIKMEMLEKNFGRIKQTLENSSSTDKHAVTLDGENSYVFSEQWKKENIVFKLRSNGRNLTLKRIDIVNAAESQLRVLEPQGARELDAESEISIILEVHTMFIGESKECIKLDFGTFKATHHLTIIVCETKEEAKLAELRQISAAQMAPIGRNAAQRSRHYTQQVYSLDNIQKIRGESKFVTRRFVGKNLNKYEVPSALRQIVLGTEKLSVMESNLTDSYPCLNEPLTLENYGQRFSLLLHLEEIQLTMSIRNYDRERASFVRDGDFLSLKIENLAERRPSLVLGDSVRAINPWLDVNDKTNKIYEGFIHKVLFDRVLLKFNTNFHSMYNGDDYRITFHFSRLRMRKQHYAVRNIVGLVGKHFLFPNKITKREKPQMDVIFKNDTMHLYDDQLPWFNKSLNAIQKRAVANILRGETENTPYVIFGPPGTGKTETVVETVLQLVRNLSGSRLLVCAPSNSAANLITKRIIASNELPIGDFIRVVSQNQIEKDLIPEELKEYCATVDLSIADGRGEGMTETESGLKLRCKSKFLGFRRVIISTCFTIGSFIQMDFPPNHFTHLIIDESGQCSEPEALVPIVALNRGQVILAGDHNQLQPLVLNYQASAFGLKVSFMERILECAPYKKDKQRFPEHSGYNPSVITKLLNNYRALPSIVDVYSKLFYDDELVSMISVKDSRETRMLADLHSIFEPHTSDIPMAHGTFFKGIEAENMQDLDSPSWYNPKEAREVFLTTLQLYRRNIQPDQIGLMTPYARQVKCLRNLFISADIVMPKIATVEEFQGLERDIILISTVRSTASQLLSDKKLNLGFVRCQKRMNVAISRARALMIVFGNPNLLCVDEYWRRYILYCANNNAYFGCEVPEILLPKKDYDGNTSQFFEIDQSDEALDYMP